MQSEAKMRFIKRMKGLFVVSLLAAALHVLFKNYGGVVWVLLEVAAWGFYGLYEWGSSLSRLKSRPDSQAIPLGQLYADDFGARTFLVGYVIALLVGVYWQSTHGGLVSVSPGVLFVLVAPLVLFTFWRQYHLELRANAT